MASKIDDPRLRPEDGPAAAARGVQEFAPSELRADEPNVARLVGLVGLVALVFGVFGLIVNARAATPRLIGPFTWPLLLTGLAGLLFHAARDPDVQVRRTYGAFGYLCLAVGVILALLPGGPGNAAGYYLLPWGVLTLAVGLLFVLAFGRVETHPPFAKANLYTLTGIGAAAAAVGLIGGLLRADFLVNPGLVLLGLGLIFLWAAIGLGGAHAPYGYTLALALGGVGAAAFLYGLIRSAGPPLLHWVGVSEARPAPFLVPAGFLFMFVGAVYGLIALGIVSDNRLVVMTRRELVAIFYSPIAYLVLFGMVVINWGSQWYFVDLIYRASRGRSGGLPEPIVEYGTINIVTAMAVVFIVPVLTMRLFSEEKRTGSLDVLMSVPIPEWMVVLSKFLAALTFYMLLWLPWALCLLGLRVLSGQEFDYRPVMAFLVVLLATGGSFVSMGLFFSSLTRNQIIAAVLTFMGMIIMLLFYILRPGVSAPEWQTVLKHLSFVDLWFETLAGKLWLRDLLLHLSITVFWLTLTVKVLEARKWT
jgi:ABC-2 type transport system permease protein